MFWRKISYKNKYEKDFNSILIPCNSPFHHQKLLPHSRKFPQHNFSPFGCLGIFNISNALAVTNTARVESRPPLIPTTAD